MRYRGGERGISFIGLMFVLVVLAFAGLFGLKLFPIYMESFKIDKAMKGLVEDSKIEQRTKQEIRGALIKRLDIDNVKAIGHGNMKEHLEITKIGGDVALDLSYEQETPLFGNISLLVTFEKHVEN